jgi:hypothetical protein
MVIMGRGRSYEPETCSGALMSALAKMGNRATSQDLFNQVKKLGHWTDVNIWQEILSHTINLPPSYRVFPAITPAQRFLFLREDGNYEMYDMNWHGRYEQGKRVI